MFGLTQCLMSMVSSKTVVLGEKPAKASLILIWKAKCWDRNGTWDSMVQSEGRFTASSPNLLSHLSSKTKAWFQTIKILRWALISYIKDISWEKILEILFQCLLHVDPSTYHNTTYFYSNSNCFRLLLLSGIFVMENI